MCFLCGETGNLGDFVLTLIEGAGAWVICRDEAACTERARAKLRANMVGAGALPGQIQAGSIPEIVQP